MLEPAGIAVMEGIPASSKQAGSKRMARMNGGGSGEEEERRTGSDAVRRRRGVWCWYHF